MTKRSNLKFPGSRISFVNFKLFPKKTFMRQRKEKRKKAGKANLSSSSMSDSVIAFLTCSDRIDWPCKYFYLQINDVSLRDCPLMDKVWSKNPLSNQGAFAHAPPCINASEGNWDSPQTAAPPPLPQMMGFPADSRLSARDEAPFVGS